MSVPPHVRAASLAVFDLHDPSIATLALVGDSLVDGELDVGEGADRHLIFRNAHVRVDLSVRLDGRRRHIAVDIEPSDFGEVTLVRATRGGDAEIAGKGASLESVGAGVVTLLLRRPADGALVRTAWVRI